MKWRLCILAITVLIPVLVSAQAPETELQIQIRAALQADADAQGYTPAELDALSAALAENAEQEGISADEVGATYGFAPEAFETEDEEIAPTVSGASENRNPWLVIVGVALLGLLSWFLVRSKHSPVSDQNSAAPLV